MSHPEAVAMTGRSAATRQGGAGARRVDKLASAVMALCALLALAPLVGLVWTTVSRGLSRLDLSFVTESMRGITGAGGGALHAIVGTVMITAAATIMAAPLGLVTALWLVEEADRSRRPGVRRAGRGIRLLIDVMTGIPSIVAGLAVYALVSIVATPGTRSGLAGAIALAIIMTPVVERACEEVLIRVPEDLREGALALGSSRWRSVWHVVLPTASPGVVSAVVLGVSRIVGETAPLLLVAGFTDSMNYNLFSGRMASLPVFVYSQWQNKGVDGAAYNARAWSAALLLIIFVLAMHVVARVSTNRKKKD